MNATEHPVPPKKSLLVCAEVPETLALKNKLNETEAAETWEVFDRIKKKKLILKRTKSPVDAPIFEQFKTDIEQWEQLRETISELPEVMMLGQDADGIWYAREMASGHSFAELVASKPMKEHEAARRVLALTAVLDKLHQAGFFHHNIKPTNIYSVELDDGVVVDPDFGRLRNGIANPAPFGAVSFLAPEQRSETPPDAPPGITADVWSLAALLAFCLTGKSPEHLHLEQIPETFRPLISAGMQNSPQTRPAALAEFYSALEQLVKTTRPSSFTAGPAPIAPSVPLPTTPPAPAAAQPSPSVAAAPITPPQGTVCPQCHKEITATTDRVCSQCGRPYFEPCLNCQSLSPFWIQSCPACGEHLLTLKQQMFANLNSQKQQILKFRETYAHERTLPLLKYMSTVNHPDFVAFKEWARSMTLLIQKERRDIKSYVESVRAQANSAMESQKYERVRQILEQVPRQLLDDELRQQYVDAGEALTEVDSLIREIRNAISTKQYSQLLSCVQRYLELKENDPEAKNLQHKIEKLTTSTSAKGMKLRRIPSGRFYMGSHDSDEYLRNNEHPQHRVSIAKNLFVGVYPVTQKQFLEVMGFNPSMSTEIEDCPVESVTWFSAIEFCNKMSELESLTPYYELKSVRRRGANSEGGAIEGARVSILGGDGYRLPSEAEWEYMCRAGSVSPWCFGDQIMEVGHYAWYFDNSSSETHPVGQRKPNSWGLYDMHGNVLEWCFDWYNDIYYQSCPEETENPTGPEEGNTKVIRGGAWQFGAEATRCAYRNNRAPEDFAAVIGFRVCRNADDEAM